MVLSPSNLFCDKDPRNASNVLHCKSPWALIRGQIMCTYNSQWQVSVSQIKCPHWSKFLEVRSFCNTLSASASSCPHPSTFSFRTAAMVGSNWDSSSLAIACRSSARSRVCLCSFALSSASCRSSSAAILTGDKQTKH